MEKVSRRLKELKESVTEKFDYLRDVVKKHKRQTVYSIVIAGSAGAPYLITGNPQSAVMGIVISGTACMFYTEKKRGPIDLNRKLSQYSCKD